MHSGKVALTLIKRKNKAYYEVRFRVTSVYSLAFSVFAVILAIVSSLTIYTQVGVGTVNAATNSTINFQARLLSNTGALIPDGNYHIEFKIYDSASGGASAQGVCSGDSSTDDCWWRETRTTGNLVTVKNGYVTASLGSVTSFPANMPWDQELWLSMNIGGNGGGASWDGEMTPRMKITAVPYAMRSAEATQLKTNNGAITSTLSLASPTVGNQVFQIQDQGAGGTYNLCIQNSTACGFALLGGANSFTGVNTFSAAGTALQVTNNATIGGTLGVTGLTTATGGLTVGTGSNFINQGSTRFTAVAISDLPTGGNIGTAALTVDAYTTFNISQTTTGQTLTLPTPTDTTAGRIVFVNNIGTASFTMYGSVVAAGQSNTYIWNGANWVTTVSLSGSVVNTIGTLDSVTKSADGASITANAIYLQSADATYAGLVSTSTQTFAGNKTFNGNIILAANQSLTVTGGNTASRPGSPTEGMVYFDTDTDKLLTYSNGKWQADRSTATKIVAASNSSQAVKDSADYVADGTDDQVQINAALTAAAGGTVYLAEGTYTTHRTDNGDATIFVPNNTILAGAGNATLIQLGDIDVDDNVIENSDTTTGAGITIRDIRIDGQRSLNTTGTQYAIYIDGLGSSSSRRGGYFTNLSVNNFRSTGFRFNNSWNNIITNNTTYNNAGSGIYIGSTNGSIISNNTSTANTIAGISINSSSTGNTITGNILRGNIGYGIYLASSGENAISGNTIDANDVGVYSTLSNGNSITANKFSGNGGATRNRAIELNDSDYANITANIIIDGSCTTNCVAINILDAGSSNTYIADNTIRSNGGAAYPATINDAGTGTIYGNQTITANQILQSSSGLIKANTSVELTGDIDPVASTTVTGTGTYFLSELQVGDRITVTGETRTVTAIASDTSLTVDVAFSDNANDTTPDRLPAALVVKDSTGATRVTIDSTGALNAWGGSITVGTATQAGTLTISDGTSNTVTIASGSQTGNYTVSLPDSLSANDTICLQAAGNCAVSSASYIQNQLAGQQATSNFWISGTGRADTSFTTPLLDTATAVALNIGTTNATSINLNQNTTLAAGKSLNITGGNTASRPGSPTEGMIYYDTDTDKLLIYSNGKWQADRNTATKIVAASNSSQAVKDSADYVADGTADQTEINSAITAVNSAGGGTVYLAEGTYTINAKIDLRSNVKILGAGIDNTVITIANALDPASITFMDDVSSGQTNVVVSSLTLNGNGANNTIATAHNAITFGGGTVTEKGITIDSVEITGFEDYSIDLDNSNSSTIANSNFDGENLSTTSYTIVNVNGQNNEIRNNTITRYGLVIASSSGQYNTFSGNIISNINPPSNNNSIIAVGDNWNVSDNIVYTTDSSGITVGNNSIVNGNNISGARRAISLVSKNNVVITDNIITGSTNNAIHLNSSDNNKISGNRISSGTGTSEAIYITGGSDNNQVEGNYLYDNGSSTANNSIVVDNNSDNNSVTTNTVVDTSCTTNCYAIRIVDSTSQNNYLFNNRISGPSAHVLVAVSRTLTFRTDSPVSVNPPMT